MPSTIFCVSVSQGNVCSLKYFQLRYSCFKNIVLSVPDPQLMISDTDPQIEKQEFRILYRILDLDTSVN